MNIISLFTFLLDKSTFPHYSEYANGKNRGILLPSREFVPKESRNSIAADKVQNFTDAAATFIQNKRNALGFSPNTQEYAFWSYGAILPPITSGFWYNFRNKVLSMIEEFYRLIDYSNNTAHEPLFKIINEKVHSKNVVPIHDDTSLIGSVNKLNISIIMLRLS